MAIAGAPGCEWLVSAGNSRPPRPGASCVPLTPPSIAAWNFAISLGFRNCFFYFCSARERRAFSFRLPPRHRLNQPNAIKLYHHFTRWFFHLPLRILLILLILQFALLACVSFEASNGVGRRERNREREKKKNRSRKMTFVGFRNFHCTRN